MCYCWSFSSTSLPVPAAQTGKAKAERVVYRPLEEALMQHGSVGCAYVARWLGHGTMVLLTLHGWGFWALWIWQGEPARGIGWQPQGTNMLAGAISWLCGAALWVTATSYVRRNYFEVWRLPLPARELRRALKLPAWCKSPVATMIDTGTELMVQCRCSTGPTFWAFWDSSFLATCTGPIFGLLSHQVWQLTQAMHVFYYRVWWSYTLP